MTTLKFRYLKNVTIDLGDGQRYGIPYKMEPSEKSGYDTKIPVFDLNHVHVVTLKSEEVTLPDRVKGMPERLYEKLCEEAYQEAANVAKQNNEVRKRAKVYADGEVIEILKPEVEVEPETPVETKPSKPAKATKGDKPADPTPDPTSEGSEAE